MIIQEQTKIQHSYLPREHWLNSKKDTAKHILEVGIHNGVSIKLWSDYFTNANVYSMDIMHIDNVSSDAYDIEFLNNIFSKYLKCKVWFTIRWCQCWEWIEMLKIVVPEHLIFIIIKIYDSRQNKNRYDDIFFSIDKSIYIITII